jgi:short-subunit dehydrogenase
MHKDTILITGASRGIGAAIARRLATPSRRLMLVARSSGPLDALASELQALGCEAQWASVDLCDAQERLALIARMNDEFGESLRGIVLNAGVAYTGDFLAQPDEMMHIEMGLNYEAPLALIRGLLPGLIDREDAFIVAVSSLTSLLPFPGHTTYSASKSALTGLMRSLAAEYESRAVHLGVVLPGYTDTSMTESLDSIMPPMTPEQVADEVAQHIVNRDVITIPGMGNKLASMAFQLFPSLGYQALAQLGDYLIPSENPS